LLQWKLNDQLLYTSETKAIDLLQQLLVLQRSQFGLANTIFPRLKNKAQLRTDTATVVDLARLLSMTTGHLAIGFDE